jgi:hypothetical protein
MWSRKGVCPTRRYLDDNLAHHRSVAFPAEPSTVISWPLVTRCVALPVRITAGMSYSWAAIEPWARPYLHRDVGQRGAAVQTVVPTAMPRCLEPPPGAGHVSPQQVAHLEPAISRHLETIAQSLPTQGFRVTAEVRMARPTLAEGLMIRWQPFILTPSGNELGVNGRGCGCVAAPT